MLTKKNYYPWIVVVILQFCYTISFVDRQVLNLMIEPIKASMGISDTQISLLIGLAFALFYASIGLPIGRMVDRMDRTRIITYGVALWSVMTSACGLAGSYWQLFLARMGVGVGEAALAPAAYSIIADYFQRERLGLASAIYASATYIGGAVAMIAGGYLLTVLATVDDPVLPLVGVLQDWQQVFVMVGLPGVFVALLVRWLVAEPERRGRQLPVQLSLVQTLRQLGQFKGLLQMHLLGFGLMAMIGYAISSWVPTFMLRTYGWDIARVGLYCGAVLGGAGVVGVLLGGLLSDYFTRRGVACARAKVACGAAFLSIPATLLFPLQDNSSVGIALLAVSILLQTVAMGIAPVILQEAVPNQLRGQTIAIYILVTNIFGLVLGPTLVALFTDYLFGDEASLRYSLSLLATVAMPCAVVCLYRLTRSHSSVVLDDGLVQLT